MIKKYRKKPVIVSAIQFDGWNWRECYQFMSNEPLWFTCDVRFEETIEINTLEGVMTASVGDYIIKGIHGEFYPCKPDIFEKTYELADMEKFGDRKYSVALDTIDTLIHLICGQEREDGYEPTMQEVSESVKTLKDLIEEHQKLKNENIQLKKEYDFMETNFNEATDHLNNFIEITKNLELKEKQWIETEKDYRKKLKELKSNSPLKFEELEEGMMIWDSKYNETIIILKLNKELLRINEGIHSWMDDDDDDWTWIDFEEGRFYRKAVF